MPTTQPIRSLHDIVTLRNIDNEDFTFEYDRSRGNYPYTIKAGAIARFPRFLADHAIKHLINKLILKMDKVRTNNEAVRADLYAKVFVEEEVFQQAPMQDENQITNRRIQELNQPSELDKVLSRAKTNAPSPTKVEPVVVPPPPTAPSKLPAVGDFSDEGEEEVVDEPPVETPPKKTEIKERPTRAQLLEYAGKQGLVLDEPDKQGKTLRQTLMKMTVDQLIAELQFPTE